MRYILRICSSDDALRAAKIDEQNATKKQFENKTDTNYVVITKPTRADNDCIILTCKRDVYHINIILVNMLCRVTRCVCAAQIVFAGGADAVTVQTTRRQEPESHDCSAAVCRSRETHRALRRRGRRRGHRGPMVRHRAPHPAPSRYTPNPPRLSNKRATCARSTPTRASHLTIAPPSTGLRV